jgi:predicted TIM-barrel fold metal-dependent hydrolase
MVRTVTKGGSMGTREQVRLNGIVKGMGEVFAERHGMTRRQFLRTPCGLAMTFFAMNMVYGPLFAVDAAEMTDKDAAKERKQSLAKQFIFDAQLHFVQDAYSLKGILGLRKRAKAWNPDLKGEETSLEQIKFENFFKEVFLESQTTIGLLSSAPADDPAKWFITNEQIFKARKIVNDRLRARRLLTHAVFTPGQTGWLAEVDRAIEQFKPDGWKGYTIGDPMSRSRYPWRLDDEKLVYPAYEKMAKAGILNVCIHKGLLPADYRSTLPDLWKFGTVEDLGRAAKDWPGLNFLIYHSALETTGSDPGKEYARFEKTHRIPWVSDLAEIPERYGVTNVYAEIGSSFAATCISNPVYCAAMLGTLIKGLGIDHVIWGTDSIWYGSPQWQIEAMRRIEIPKKIREKHGFSILGPADGPVKTAVFGANSAKLFGVKSQIS